jgi:hypothetical protein
MRKVLSYHKVGLEFLDLLLSFSNGGTESEAGPGSLTFKNTPGGVCGVYYLTIDHNLARCQIG